MTAFLSVKTSWLFAERPAPQDAGQERRPDLGRVIVTLRGDGVTFAFRAFSTSMGTRKNDDGTLSLVALGPSILFPPLVVGPEGGKPAPIARDGQHEFKFVAPIRPVVLVLR